MAQGVETRKGFTLIELLVVMAIIGILSTIAMFTLNVARIKARDAERKSELAQYGRILTANCYVPDAGPGDYDLADFMPELKLKNPQFSELLKFVPQDPSGTLTETKYRYIVTATGQCAVYGNLEYGADKVNVQGISTATPNGGTGVFEGSVIGPNGSNKYFQVSN